MPLTAQEYALQIDLIRAEMTPDGAVLPDLRHGSAESRDPEGVYPLSADAADRGIRPPFRQTIRTQLPPPDVPSMRQRGHQAAAA
jgi:hypothetical protein